MYGAEKLRRVALEQRFRLACSDHGSERPLCITKCYKESVSLKSGCPDLTGVLLVKVSRLNLIDIKFPLLADCCRLSGRSRHQIVY